MTALRIYVASSWRNQRQPAVVQALREAGHAVYDFRNPHPRDHGFHWEDVDPNWAACSAEDFRALLQHPVAQAGFRLDREAMGWANAVVLVLPSGRSSHLEAGWMAGAGKLSIVLLGDTAEPELMYLLADYICVSMEEVLVALRQVAQA